MVSTSSTKDEVFIVGYPSQHITGCKLPSNRQVLANLFYNLRSEKMNFRDSAKITIQKVLIFWGKSHIPTKKPLRAIIKLKELHAEWRSLQKVKHRISETVKNKIKKFASKLDDIFDIAHQDALAMMTSEDDKEFLLKQREKTEPSSMLGVGLKQVQVEEKELSKINKQSQVEHFDIETDNEEGEDSDEEESDEDMVGMDICTSQETKEHPRTSDSTRTKRGAKEILTMKLSLLLDQCKISNSNASQILIATIEALGENPDEFNLSKTAIQEKRKVFREKYTQKNLARN